MHREKRAYPPPSLDLLLNTLQFFQGVSQIHASALPTKLWVDPHMEPFTHPSINRFVQSGLEAVVYLGVVGNWDPDIVRVLIPFRGSAGVRTPSLNAAYKSWRHEKVREFPNQSSASSAKVFVGRTTLVHALDLGERSSRMYRWVVQASTRKRHFLCCRFHRQAECYYSTLHEVVRLIKCHVKKVTRLSNRIASNFINAPR